MTTIFFVSALGAVLLMLLAWSFRVLPSERWQMLAAVPLDKNAQGQWRGRNLTFYGVFTANAYVVAMVVALLLLSAVGVPCSAIITLAIGVLAVCIPASRFVAMLVEGKKHTFTVAGAFFVGIIVAPLAVITVNALFGTAWRFTMPLLPTLAALAIAYAFGEGLGRLACISFGCCYGKPLEDCPRWIQRWFASRSFVFSGCTKKASYEADLEGVRLLPIQAITTVILVGTGLVATLLYLQGAFREALVATIAVTQFWRLGSEFFRADFRGGQGISAYQVMAAIAVFYTAFLAFWLHPEGATPIDPTAGLYALWDPGVILFLQSLWLVLFLYTGRSEVTSSILSFHVCRDRI